MRSETLVLGPMICTLCLFAAFDASANVIYDPDNTGATAVFPDLRTGEDTNDAQINVGFSGVDGAVEVNAETNTNGVTSFAGSGLIIGNQGTSGLVRVRGNGTTGSARVDILGDGFGLRNGLGGMGTLEILDGGLVSSEQEIFLGNQGLADTAGQSTVRVEGSGSVLRAQRTTPADGGRRFGGRINIGFDGVSDSTLTVANGGTVEALNEDFDSNDFYGGEIYIGGQSDPGSRSIVDVTGVGSTLRAEDAIYVLGDAGSESALSVADGGKVDITSANNSSFSVGADEAAGARVDISGVAADGTASSFTANEMQIGFRKRIAGFTAEGEPVAQSSVDQSTLVDGAQATDRAGNPLFDRDGNAILAGPITDNNGDPILDSNGNPIAIVPEGVDIKTGGQVTVENGADLTIRDDINISFNDSDSNVRPLSDAPNSSLTVRNGGHVKANNIFVNEDGLLNGDGGLIDSDVTINGGTVAPGNSPGTLQIEGDLVFNSGLLELEYDSSTLFDQLLVDGDIFFGENAIIQAIFNTAPGTDILFDDFFGGIRDFTLAQAFDPSNNLQLVFADGSGVQPGDIFNVNFAGQSFKLAATGAAPADVPEPSSLPLLIAGLLMLGFASYRRQRMSGA